MARGRSWTRDELRQVLKFYVQAQFGRIHSRNPEIIAIANSIGRSPSSVAMKALNFASMDPIVRSRGRVGLEGASVSDRAVWDEANRDWNSFALSFPAAADESSGAPIKAAAETLLPPVGPTERMHFSEARVVQKFFRSTVLAAYGDSCAISDVAVPELLNASHIIPWSHDENRRANPRNGIALNALYDRAFDRGLIALTDDLTVLVSSRLKAQGLSDFARSTLVAIEGRKARAPERFTPDPIALEYHRDTCFVA